MVLLRRVDPFAGRRRPRGDVVRGGLDFLLPDDRDEAAGREPPEALRGRAGEDARVAMG